MKGRTRSGIGAVDRSARAAALSADDDLAQRIAACTREQDDARRLACFDRAAAPKAAAAPAVNATNHSAFSAASSRAAATMASSSPRDRRNESARRLRPSRSGRAASWSSRWTTARSGRRRNGAYFPLKVGDPVSILAGTLGSFRLIAGNRATAVTRVQ
jgi:hypothetical protein